ncbi:MAG: hypothetical protein MZV63_39160 [Marinilabiliales bacterium]|nr:hypothetical protein [Marinilabiliales bacterium]
MPVEGEPRLMRRADAVKGEKGIYKLYTEGIDDDGDGQYNEDTPGGTNVNINFPHLFKSFGKRRRPLPRISTRGRSPAEVRIRPSGAGNGTVVRHHQLPPCTSAGRQERLYGY